MVFLFTMTELEKIIELGERLGYKEDGLKKFVDSEIWRQELKRKEDLDRENHFSRYKR